MEYIEIIKINSEFHIVIDDMIKIYKNIENKKIKCKKYKKYSLTKNYESIKLSDADKKCVALLLALIYNNTNINTIFQENGISEKNLLKYFKLKQMPLGGYMTSNEYEECYDKKFKLFIDRIIRNVTNDILIKLPLSIESLCFGLKNEDFCSSSIVENIFKHYGLESRCSYKFEHAIFDNIEELAKQKGGKTLTKEDLDNCDSEKSNEDSYLNKYGVNLNNVKYTTNPALGRDNEIKEIIIGLLLNRSVILTGPSAVGKTAIIEGLAYQIQNKKAPKELEDIEIIKINSASLVSGCRYVGTLEKRMEEIIQELKDNKNIILFIDEFHTLIGAGAGNNSNLDIANILKPYLDRGQITIIGATTDDEYDKYISSDSAFKRRFERIKVNELNDRNVKAILIDVIYKMEINTGVEFDFSEKEIYTILNIMAELTQDKNRVYNDKIKNPELAINILKKSFAYAIYDKNKIVTIDNIITSIVNCDRIYDSVKKRYIEQLKNINSNTKVNNSSKIIQFKKPIQ